MLLLIDRAILSQLHGGTPLWTWRSKCDLLTYRQAKDNAQQDNDQRYCKN